MKFEFFTDYFIDSTDFKLCSHIENEVESASTDHALLNLYLIRASKISYQGT